MLVCYYYIHSTQRGKIQKSQRKKEIIQKSSSMCVKIEHQLVT